MAPGGTIVPITVGTGGEGGGYYAPEILIRIHIRRFDRSVGS